MPPTRSAGAGGPDAHLDPPSSCAICSGDSHTVLYHGPIRMGRFGTASPEPRTVWRCDGCGAAHLPGPAQDYESSAYRELVDGSADVDDFHRLHDAEQAEKLRVVGTGHLRGSVLMDVGCGAGSFLDTVRGLCRTTIGIEPTASLRAALARKGHEAFPYCADVPDVWKEQVDVAVSFSVVEHLPDPLGFLRDLRRLVKPGGRLVVSTPNRRDWLLDLLPDDYGRFFYRAVHLWYFDTDALGNLLRAAGFTDVSVSYVHCYDLSNAILWLRDRRPTGLGALPMAAAADAVFKGLVEAGGVADYLYASSVRA